VNHSVTTTGLPPKVEDAKIAQYRIDETHSNAFTAWKPMGSPQKPTPEQYADLERAGRLAAAGPSEAVQVTDGKITTCVKLGPQAVALLVLEWTPK
jgi:xylan 1,4-beta-xylosidase